MPKKFVTVAQFRDLARKGERPDCGVIRAGTIVGADEERRAIRYCYSDDSVDHYGDTIDAQGWDLDTYASNPVALWAHDASSPPIGRGANVVVEGNRLMGDIEYASPDVYPFADTIYRLATGGFLKAVSVGFIPLEWSFVNEPDRPFGIDFKRQELLEISACPIPANPNALAEAMSKGIDIAPLREWAEHIFGADGLVAFPAARLEAIKSLPAALREIAEKLPAPAKTARGQYLRCANIVERAIAGEPEPKSETGATPRLAMAARKLALLRSDEARISN